MDNHRGLIGFALASQMLTIIWCDVGQLTVPYFAIITCRFVFFSRWIIVSRWTSQVGNNLHNALFMFMLVEVVYYLPKWNFSICQLCRSTSSVTNQGLTITA
jgi:hypothetical protein